MLSYGVAASASHRVRRERPQGPPDRRKRHQGEAGFGGAGLRGLGDACLWNAAELNWWLGETSVATSHCPPAEVGLWVARVLAFPRWMRFACEPR
jgi:hypothetical protein